MSIFSRKTKAKEEVRSAQPQQANGKSVPQQDRQTPSRQGANNGLPNGVPHGPPILQRITQQAASRKRMNSETPDYSIKSASFSNANKSSPTLTGGRDRASFGNKENFMSKTITTDSAVPHGQKSRTNSGFDNHLPPTQAYRPSPENQKMRMSPKEFSNVGPQAPGDSGYGSLAQSAVASRTPSEAHRQRRVNASMPPMSGIEPLPQGVAIQSLLMDDSPLSSSEMNGTTESKGYVSRLDPGPVSPLLTDSTTTYRASPKQSRRSTLPENVSQPAQPVLESQRIVPVEPSKPATPKKKRQDGSKKSGEHVIAAPQQIVPEQASETKERGRTVSQDVRPGPMQNPGTREGSKAVPEQATNESVQPDAQSAILSQRPLQASDTSFSRPLTRVHTPKTSESNIVVGASPKKSTRSATTPTGSPKQQVTNAIMTSSTSSIKEGSQAEPDATPKAPEQPMFQPAAPFAAPPRQSASSAGNSDVDSHASSQAYWTPPVQTSFPYLQETGAGTPERRATLPPLSSLDGFKVNRRGQILDEEGLIIGALVQGEIIDCVRQKVNAQGEVVDEYGRVVGQARTVTPGMPPPPVSNPEDWPMSPTSRSERGGSMSSLPAPQYFMQPNGSSTSQTSRSVDQVVKSGHSPAQSQDNVFIAELDASVEAQATPVLDHSEIFNPGFTAPTLPRRADTFASVDNATLLKLEGKQPPKRHSTAIKKTNTWSEHQPKKWASRYFESSTPNGGYQKSQPASKSLVELPERPDHARSESWLSARPAASGPPRAVIGPTLESLQATIPEAQALPQKAVPITIAAPQASPTLPNGLSYAATSKSGNLSNKASRRFSAASAAKGANHQPFVKSPLSSIANTPPESSAGEPADKGGQRHSIGASLMHTASTKRQSRISIETDDGAAPAPVVKKAEAVSLKSGKNGGFRKSIFGFRSLGKKSQPTAAH